MDLKITVSKPQPIEVLMFVKPEEQAVTQNQFHAIKCSERKICVNQVGVDFTVNDQKLRSGDNLMVRYPNNKIYRHTVLVHDTRLYFRAIFRGLKIAFEVDENDGLQAYILPKV